MNIINILRRLIDVFFFGVVIITIIIAGLMLFGKLPFKESFSEITQQSVNFNSLYEYAVIVLSIIGISLFILILFFIRKVVIGFSKDEIFNRKSISNLNIAGALICIYAFLKNGLISLKLWIQYGSYTFCSLNFNGFDSFWFLLILGLFFIYLAKVLDKAAFLKQENDLTI